MKVVEFIDIHGRSEEQVYLNEEQNFQLFAPAILGELV